MKASLVVLAAYLLTTSALQAKTLIVSDVDDTIKLTDVLNSKKQIVKNALFSKKAFSGMSQLYRELDKKEASIHYVSGSPGIIRKVIHNFLDCNEFPQNDQIILKTKKVETYHYKVDAIKKLIAKHNPDEIILIGDDTEVDPEVYDTISKLNPLKVSGIYIRAVQNRALPSNGLTRNFFSAVEIAGVEHVKGNLDEKSLSRVAESFINQDHKSELAIVKRYCPADGRAELEELKQQVSSQQSIDDLEKTQAKIIKSCTQS